MGKVVTTLPVEHEEFTCTRYAEGQSYREIARALEARGYKTNHMRVMRFLTHPSNLQKITKYRDKFMANPLTVDLAQKKVRLLDADRERRTIILTLQTFKEKKGTVKEKKWGKYLQGVKRLIEIEIFGRDEIEKKPDMIALFQRIGPLSDLDDVELQKEAGIIEQKLLVIRGGKGITAEAFSHQAGNQEPSQVESA